MVIFSDPLDKEGPAGRATSLPAPHMLAGMPCYTATTKLDRPEPRGRPPKAPRHRSTARQSPTPCPARPTLKRLPALRSRAISVSPRRRPLEQSREAEVGPRAHNPEASSGPASPKKKKAKTAAARHRDLGGILPPRPTRRSSRPRGSSSTCLVIAARPGALPWEAVCCLASLLRPRRLLSPLRPGLLPALLRRLLIWFFFFFFPAFCAITDDDI